MSKIKAPHRPNSRRGGETAPQHPKGAEQPSAARQNVNHPARSNSKQAEIIGLLTRPSGATITSVMQATGWQQHSVRGFLAGVVRRKLGLPLTSEKPEGGERVYRIVAGTPSKAKGKVGSVSRQAA